MDGLGGLSLGTERSLYGVAAGPLRSEDYICVVDEKAQNTNGGDFTLGAWRTRDLNTIRSDAGGNARLSANQLFLASGIYQCWIWVPAYGVDRHQASLQNVTTATRLILGMSAFAYSVKFHQTSSIIVGRFIIQAGHALEVQHKCAVTSGSGYGYGVAGNFATEVYTVAEFWRERS